MSGSAFTATVKKWGLRHFVAEEFLVKTQATRGRAKNSPPPPEMWGNMRATAKVVDELRHRLGHPVRITSAYRNPAYNRAIGGAKNSEHMQFRALDIQCDNVPPKLVAQELRTMRDAGMFKGGIGTYATFVHVDTRGKNVTW